MGALRPLVFVGCGGSGGKTLRITHDAILRRLKRTGWTKGMPDAWQFLWIDVPATQEGGEVFGKELPASSYLGLVKPSTNYRTGIDEAVMAIRNADPMEMVGWRPNPDDVNILIENGAGQFRAIGRMISVRHGADIADRIAQSYDATATASAFEELMKVGEALGAEAQRNPRVFLVSSLAGGSGAGTFLDIADILAIHSGSSESIAGILYTADVFSDVPGVEGVAGNSLASLAELLSGYWSEDERSISLFRAQGMSSGRIVRGGLAYPFLIGSTNANGVSLEHQVEVYRSIGELLALITVSGEVQEEFINFLTVNWSSSGVGNADLLGLQGPQKVPATSSLGYSRIGLGRDRFKEYAIRRIARGAIEFLSTGYLAKSSNLDERMTPSEALRSIVEQNKLRFLQDCGLNEREDSNQIVDALTPKATETLWKKANGAIAEKQASATPADLNTWLRRYESTSALLAKDFATSFDNALNQSTTAWASIALDRVLGTVNEYISDHGIPVAIELLMYTKGELEDVADQLIGEAGKWETDGGNWLGRVGQLGLPLADRFGADHPKMSKIIQSVTSPWYYGSLAKVRRRASALMIEFAREVIAPLAATLRVAHATFESDTAPKAGESPEYMDWPKDESIPDALRPSKVEFLLEDVDSYPSTFLHLVAATTTKEEKATGEPFAAAIRDVIRGGFQSASMTPTPPSVRRDLNGMDAGDVGPWMPTLLGGTGDPVGFIGEFRQSDLLERVEEWILQPGAFRDYLDESLSDYLGDRDAKGDLIEDHQQRLSTFKAKFTAALASSAPLIDVDTNLYAKTHPRALEHHSIIEPLPFPLGHPAREVASEILIKQQEGSDGSAQDLERNFTSASAGVGSVGIISYFMQPVHPVVFKSVTTPIDEKLQMGKAEFWLWRRTRRLAEFVPIDSSARKAMTRGWYTARALGMLDTENSEAPMRVLSAHGEWLSFPYVPLGGFVDKTDLPFAAVLESLPLCWIGWAAGRPEEVEAYRRLLQLGLSRPSLLTTMGGDGQSASFKMFSYEDVNPEILDWVTSGSLPPQSHPVVHGDNSEARIASIREVLSGMIDVLTSSFKLPGTDSISLLHAPRGIDLIDEVISEIRQVVNARYVVDPPPLP